MSPVEEAERITGWLVEKGINGVRAVAVGDQRRLVLGSRQFGVDENWQAEMASGALVITVAGGSEPTQLRVSGQLVERLGLTGQDWESSVVDNEVRFRWKLPSEVRLVPGRLTGVATSLALELRFGGTASAWLIPIGESGSSVLQIQADLFIRSRAAEGDISHAISGDYLLKLPLEDAKVKVRVPIAQPTELFSVDTRLTLSLSTPELDFGLEADVPDLCGQLFDDLGQSLSKVILRAGEGAKAVWREGRLALQGLALQLGDLLELVDGRLDLDPTFVLDGESRLVLKVKKTSALLLGSGKPFSLVVHQGSRFELGFEDGRFSLSGQGSGGAPVATAYVPGLDSLEEIAKDWRYDSGEVSERFVLDVVDLDEEAQGRTAITIDSGGVGLEARARRRPVQLPVLRDTITADGQIRIRGRTWSVDIRAESALPWFENAVGSVTVRGGNAPGGATFGVRFECRMSSTWTDPSGVLSIVSPRLQIAIAWTAKKWDIQGAVGGRLVFNRAPFSGEAAAWLGDLFSGLSADFDGLSLSRLGNFEDPKLSVEDLKVRLEFKAPLELDLWSVLRLTLHGVGIKRWGIVLDGGVVIGLPGVELGGRLESMGVHLEAGHVSIRAGFPPRIEGTLRVASGMRVQMAIQRKSDDEEDVLMGAGTFSGPAMPGVGVMIKAGRALRGGEFRPTFAIFADAPVDIAVFPGICIRNVGLGLGVHQSIAAIEAAMGKSALELFVHLQQSAFPDPRSPTAWKSTEVPVTFAAQLVLSATLAERNVPDFYVAEVAASLDSMLRFGVFGQTWILTSVNDSRLDEFRRRPYARAALAIDPGEPSLVAVAETLPSPKTSLTSVARMALMEALLGAFRTRYAFEARPRNFALTAGPTGFDEQLGPARLWGKVLFGVRSSPQGTHALVHGETGASVNLTAELSFGLAKVGFNASAGFSMSATMFGGIAGGHLLLYGEASVTAHASLAVWVEIRFFVRIRIGFLKVTLGRKVRFELSFSLEVGLWAQLAIHTGSGMALAGAGHFRFKVCGIEVSARLPVKAGSTEILGAAQQLARQAIQGHLLPQGSST